MRRPCGASHCRGKSKTKTSDENIAESGGTSRINLLLSVVVWRKRTEARQQMLNVVVRHGKAMILQLQV